LNIALDDFTKEATTPPPLKRKTEFIEQEHHSPEQVQDQQQRLPEKEREQQQASPRRVQPSDTHLNNNSSPPIKKVNNFAVPASTARLHNPNDANGASFSNFQETLIPYPPREQDKIRVRWGSIRVYSLKG
jgi:hypothetical protein